MPEHTISRFAGIFPTHHHRMEVDREVYTFDLVISFDAVTGIITDPNALIFVLSEF